MSENLPKKRSEAGFTLMELIMVLVILGMIAAFAGPNLYNKFMKSRDYIAKIQIGDLEGALQLYSFDLGRFPSTSEGLNALVQNTAGADIWKGPYLNKGVPNDPWERPYGYRSPGNHGEYDLFSVGADGEEGTEDDICSWK